MYEIRPETVKTFITDRNIKLPRFQGKQTWDEKKNFQLCISLFKEYPIAEELDKMLKKNAEEKDAGVTGFRSLINPRYKAEEFLKELHKLIDGHKCKEHVPYILILMEEKALSRKPTWKEMRDEFKDIGAPSNSNYCKFMKYKLMQTTSDNSFTFPIISFMQFCHPVF